MGERLPYGELKAAVLRLADGNRTVAEIAREIGTSKASVNGCIQRHGLQDLVLKAGRAEISRQIENTLSRAIDAMSRVDPDGVSTTEWDSIIREGTALLQKVAAR